MFFFDKRILNFLVIIFLTTISFLWTFFIFHFPFSGKVVVVVAVVRLLASFFLFQDYSLSWSKATPKTFLLKSIVYGVAFVIYMPLFYSKIWVYFFFSELFLFLFLMNFSMYSYYYYKNQKNIFKTKSIVIYGAGHAGSKLENELRGSDYRIRYFVDDDPQKQKRSIDGVQIIAKEKLKKLVSQKPIDLLIIAMPSVDKRKQIAFYNELFPLFKEIKILPSLEEILRRENFYGQLKNISVEDLLARHPQDLDTKAIKNFINNKIILITGAGGTIGSQLSRQCVLYKAQKIILLDHSEFQLYQIGEELFQAQPELILQTVANKAFLEETFKKFSIDIVLHAAAYKHVPLSEDNISEVLTNNILGTKNVVDLSIKYKVKKIVLISTDKAVRPTSVMGASKRVCELYGQNSNYKNKTEVVSVRFGNVLESSGSVIPKFRKQIAKGGPVTVTHPEITRYFMLISEACELVLQAAAIGLGGEIFILDMGKPVRIADLAKKMIQLSGKENIKIKFTGLRSGEKLYEELLISGSEQTTRYQSISIAHKTQYNIERLNKDITKLLLVKKDQERLKQLKKIVPEFQHNKKETNEQT